jgi:phenylacetate-coenzyme A ligase PaaK-like adenylate-forming protein
MGIIANIRNRKILAACQEREAGYSGNPSFEERAAWQLEQINKCWQVQQTTIPAYIEGVQTAKLPRSFKSLDEFCSVMAPTTKKMVQTQMDRLSDPTKPKDFSFTTGGSTGEPTTFPFWNSEREHSVPDRWMCRRWYGVQPSDRLFMIWGHSHLLGTGLKGKWNAKLRIWKDAQLGYYRYSAYQLDPAKLRHACDEMLKFKPAYMLCYSSALDYFCRVNADRADELAKLNLKMAFGTGESFPAPDSPEWVNKALTARCAMEYGSVETGIMGFSRPIEKGLGHFDLFWRSYLFEANEPGPTGGRVIRITSLFPKKFPLIRYEIGDEVTLFEGDDPRSISRVRKIVGKSLSFVTMPDGTKVHSVAFEHSVRTVKGVERFQLVSKKGVITLKVVAPGADRKVVTDGIHALMFRIHPSLAKAEIEFTDKLIQTVAGKTPMVVLEESHLASDRR